MSWRKITYSLCRTGARTSSFLLLGALTAAAPAAARSPAPRIVAGQEAAPGEYPAQGYLKVVFAGRRLICGGSVIGQRSFLTAAHCVTDETTGAPDPPEAMRVTLRNTMPSRAPASDQYTVTAVAVAPGFIPGNAPRNDLATLTLAADAGVPPLPVVQSDQPALWAPGTLARIIGWGTTSDDPFADPSPTLLEADVPIIDDGQCTTDYGRFFDASTMVCAYDGVHDTCSGDSGGPLLAPDRIGGFVEAGVTSWGSGCAEPDSPGVYARLGAPSLNDWVRARIDSVTFMGPSTLIAGQPATFTATGRHAETTGDYAAYAWDFDGDGQYDDATGTSVEHTFPVAGRVALGVQATDTAGEAVTSRGLVDVSPVPTPAPSPSPSPTPTPSGPVTPAPRRLSVKVSRTFRVRHGRTVVRRLVVSRVPAGATVTVRCSGGGCAFKRRTATGRRGMFSLTKLFRKRALRRGAVIEVRVTAPGAIGEVIRFTTAAKRSPRRAVLCLPPGATRPGRCTQ